MKTFIILIALFLFISFSAFPQFIEPKPFWGRGVPIVNNWISTGIIASDTSGVREPMKSFMAEDQGSHFQVFSFYAWPYGSSSFGWHINSSWIKTFSSFYFSPSDSDKYFLIPDTIAIDYKFVEGINVSRILVTMGIQDSDATWQVWQAPPARILLDSGWQTIYWNLQEAKDQGMKGFWLFHLHFVVSSSGQDFPDLPYLGANMGVDNIRGIDDTLGTFLIDGFGDSTHSVYVSVPETEQISKNFVLGQNYPNPFNPSSTIKFSIPKREWVSLIVFNLLGQEVKTLVSEEKGMGSYEVRFNASNLPSGIYFYRLQVGNSIEVKKMILMK